MREVVLPVRRRTLSVPVATRKQHELESRIFLLVVPRMGRANGRVSRVAVVASGAVLSGGAWERVARGMAMFASLRDRLRDPVMWTGVSQLLKTVLATVIAWVLAEQVCSC